MFESNEIYDDDFFKGHVVPVSVSRGPSMELMLWLAAAVVTAVLLAIICRCCCRSKSRGRVIAPPPRDESVPAPYPQQQYAPAGYPTQTVTTYPVGSTPYPTAAPYPTHPPALVPYPTHAPYPAGAPYPAATPYPAAPAPAPYPAAPAPTAPDATAFYGVAPPGWSSQACPPSYEQVMSAEQHKQPPYNPHAPH